jgi:prepilin-type processing-associated H-X9-DG protein
LKQIALAFHNYHDAYQYMPAWGSDFATNPNPANPYGAQLKGHAALGLILPYVEQQNLLGLGRLDRSVIDPINMPAPLGTSPVGAVVLKLYLCPSAPERPADYAPYFWTTGLVNSTTLPSYPLGGTDYAPIKGLSTNFRTNCAPTSPTGDTQGALGPKSGKPTIVGISDGTSNTILIAEIAGRPATHINGRMVNATPVSAVWFTAWSDYDHTIRLNGFAADGTSTGCGAVNVNNRDIYAFHTGGANVARADGSVAFLKQGVNPAALGAFVTRAGNESIPLND